MNAEDKLEESSAIVCVVGLGYVWLPLAEAFSRHIRVIGYDVDEAKVAELSDDENIEFTTDASRIKEADFVIIAVPTTVTKSKDPDLSYVMSAVKTIGQNLKKGAIVVLESTVYPGVTLEEESKMIKAKTPHEIDNVLATLAAKECCELMTNERRLPEIAGIQQRF